MLFGSSFAFLDILPRRVGWERRKIVTSDGEYVFINMEYSILSSGAGWIFVQALDECIRVPEAILAVLLLEPPSSISILVVTGQFPPQVVVTWEWDWSESVTGAWLWGAWALRNSNS